MEIILPAQLCRWAKAEGPAAVAVIGAGSGLDRGVMSARSAERSNWSFLHDRYVGW